MAQFADRDRRGAALADHHRGRGIRRTHCGFVVGIQAEHGGQNRHHGIAGARHIADLHGIGRNMNGCAIARDQRHAVVAAGHQHRLAAERLSQFLRGIGDIGIALGLAPHRFRQFLAVRRHHRRAAIDAVIAALGIDDHRLAGRIGRLKQTPDQRRRQHALGVIRQHHRIRPRQCGECRLQQRLLGFGIRRPRLFPVGAQQMRGVMLRHEPHLARGRARSVNDKRGRDAGLGGERRLQRAAGIVLADQADKDAMRAEARDIARDIAGAADHHLAALDCDHRRRRLRRDAGDLAIDEVVQHQVADAQDGDAGQSRQALVEIEHQRYRSSRSRY